jgi:NAD-dependent deacetylase
MFLDRSALEQAAEALARARLVAVSSGAGISKESGVPTFRDAQDGLWAKYDPAQLATPDAFLRNPDLVWSWYSYRTRLVGDAQPNSGHLALVALENLVPQVMVLTQNVDGLHARAGSTDIVELHGRLGRWKCFASCRGEPTLVDLETVAHEDERSPGCPYCSSRLRPDVVWFGEALPAEVLDRAFDVAARCDVMLVVGTSGLVQPAASLPSVARRAGAIVIEVNPQPSMITQEIDLFLQGPSGEVLPALVDAVRLSRAHGR